VSFGVGLARIAVAAVRFETVAPGGEENGELLLGRQRFEVLAAGNFGRRERLGPGVVILVREATQTLSRGLDVETYVCSHFSTLLLSFGEGIGLG
jgi:hypothetical protein